MSYTPNNVAVYLAAFQGTISGMGAAGRALSDPTQADYAIFANVADAFAQELDTVWGANAFTAFEVNAIEECSEGVWEGGWATSVTPSDYTKLATAVIALVKEGNAKVVTEGVDPNGGNPWSGEGGGIIKIEQDIPLATLQAAGAVSKGVFNLGGVLPANARVLPAMSEIQVVQAMVADALTAAVGTIYGGYYPAGSQSYTIPAGGADLLDANANVYYGSSGGYALVGDLGPTQGGQQLTCRIQLTGNTFNNLTAGHIKARAFYVIIA